ncbi:Mediator of RNA polymerase II transcription subunit 4 [Neolecta irregularis DAH-3]|uniref:Mediator of RNA polymerase II transcription subunit 4 n=1 Tax=Neolecta irregularis (strain DAH-3) TaxID=1198029 RepID=A0A1U7LTB8_NEOID|nr:Mediator of RNA polymerase II transcription subunit 4 [Neolecta irregularis DAH-3]|eukprot:OLL25761.1 Mediator of RNA polymerase II transcription subunit 4 [Neolecta irregularis DAH-3]
MTSTGFTTLDHVLDQYQNAVLSLLDLIAVPIPSNGDVSAAADEVITVDKSLSNALDEARKHQENHSKILELRQQSQNLDMELNIIIQTLAKLRDNLTASETTESYWTSTLPLNWHFTETEGQVSHEDLLAYARKLANYTHAPADYNPERPLETFSHIHAPWPTEEAMRRGRLGLGITGERADSSMAESGRNQPTLSPVYHEPKQHYNGHIETEQLANHAAVFDDMDLFNPDEM